MLDRADQIWLALIIKPLMKAKSDVGAIFEIPAKAQVKFQIQMWARWEASASEISTGRGRVSYI